MRFHIASNLSTRQTVWAVTHASGRQSADQVSAATLAGAVRCAAYDRHGVHPNPRCPISGWRSKPEV